MVSSQVPIYALPYSFSADTLVRGPRIIGVTAVQLSGQIWGQRPKTPIQMSGQIDRNLEDTRPDVRTDLIVEHIDVRYP